MIPLSAIVTGIALSLSLMTAAWAAPDDDLQRGRDAYTAGNYDDAVSWFRKAADEGDAAAL